MEQPKSQESQTHFRLKLGSAEIEFTGNEEFLKNEIMPAVARIVSAAEFNHSIEEQKAVGQPSVIGQIEVQKKTPTRRSKPNTSTSRETAKPIEFRHNSSAFGMPIQSWATSKKAIWLLYIVGKQANVADLSAGQIAGIFNTQFRQAKTITQSNVSRDLGKAKTATPSFVGEDVAKNPSLWFLTDEGVKYAQKLIDEVMNVNKV